MAGFSKKEMVLFPVLERVCEGKENPILSYFHRIKLNSMKCHTINNLLKNFIARSMFLDLQTKSKVKCILKLRTHPTK